MAYFTSHFAVLIEGTFLMRTTTTKIEVLLLPFQFLHYVQNVCNHCKALLYFALEEK